MLVQKYKDMLSGKSVIRQLSEFATARGQEIGYENVFDYSLGNPSVPVPREFTDLDRIQVLMASSREFYIIIRLRGEQESDVFSYLSRIEQNINDNGFTTRRATEQDLKKMLGVYFEQNVTTEKFEDFDGDRWVIVGE